MSDQRLIPSRAATKQPERTPRHASICPFSSQGSWTLLGAEPSSGGDATVTIAILNDSDASDPVTITSLDDDVLKARWEGFVAFTGQYLFLRIECCIELDAVESVATSSHLGLSTHRSSGVSSRLASMKRIFPAILLLSCLIAVARAEGDWEITRESELALKRGLEWLAHPGNQGPHGNWNSNDLGLVGMGVLAFLSDGHAPGRGRYGPAVERCLTTSWTTQLPTVC